MPKYVASCHFHYYNQVWPKDCDIPTKRFAKKDLEWLLGAGWVKEVPSAETADEMISTTDVSLTEPDKDIVSGAEVENHGYPIKGSMPADN